MRENPRPYEIYKHFKGNLYQVLTLASDSETCDTLVVYQALYSPYKVWVRPLAMFMSEVDHQKYPEVEVAYRFTLQADLPNDKNKAIQKNLQDKLQGKAAAPTENGIKISEAGKTADTESTQEDFDEEISLDPLVLEFLDSDTYEQKLNILASLHSRVTDEMINTMAIAMDVEINEGDIEQRFSELQECVRTLRKYECSRLR
ncbi:MAG: DUF1653 domain-containing protein [Lachnospiraceae bacterium]|nr:DUF1653 domain-containing protein [Lachnospiraceae bacterium]